MAFQDLTEVLEPYLDLPISGKTYRVDAVDAETGLRMQTIVGIAVKVRTGHEISELDVASLKLDEAEEQEFTRAALGSALDDMRANGVPWVHITRAAETVFVWTINGREAAERVWSGKPQRPAPKDRQASAKKKSKKRSSRSSSSPRQTPDSSGGGGSSTGT